MAIDSAKTLASVRRVSLIQGCEAFVAIAGRLSPDNKTLRNSELAFFQTIAAGLKTGLDPNEAVIQATNEPPPTDNRGKRSPASQSKYEDRHPVLKKALDLVDVSVIGESRRHAQLADDINHYWGLIRAGKPPYLSTEYNYLVFELANGNGQGLKPITTAIGIWKALRRPDEQQPFPEKKKSNC